jgi:hypothetical protein
MILICDHSADQQHPEFWGVVPIEQMCNKLHMMFNLLRATLLALRTSINLRGHMCETILFTVFLDNQLVRVVIDMNIFRIDHDVICISKELGHLLEGDALRLRKHKVKHHCTKTADNNEDLPFVSV